MTSPAFSPAMPVEYIRTRSSTRVYRQMWNHAEALIDDKTNLTNGTHPVQHASAPDVKSN